MVEKPVMECVTIKKFISVHPRLENGVRIASSLVLGFLFYFLAEEALFTLSFNLSLSELLAFVICIAISCFFFKLRNIQAKLITAVVLGLINVLFISTILGPRYEEWAMDKCGPAYKKGKCPLPSERLILKK